MTGNKYCVIHGHFYQPPREDPWEDEIEKQPSAAPFHDWNDRIYDECYRPNSFSRILNGNGEIVAVNNNFSYMNFNFGPTLFRWIAKKHPTVYRRVVEADKRSCEENNGHGSAIAQVYNHIIMPLALKKDQLTQIRWAKSFFKRHFNRNPEGMWLAETAINMETVECLADENIKFVILAPTQADSFRTIGGNSHDWIYTDNQRIDTRLPYRCFVENQRGERSGKYVDVFFFDDVFSRELGFGDMLQSADHLTDEINCRFDQNWNENQLVNLATDGETFGHHKKNGDMCLAYFFRNRAAQSGIKVVNYATYLANNPPKREVRVKNAWGEGTAWSCAHGTGRWIRDCGCNTGGLPGWNQKWREPLRRALKVLQTEIDFGYQREMNEFFKNPAEIRDAYEQFIDDRSGLDKFLQKSAKKGVKLTSEQIKRIIMLLEAQKFMLFAFTSCAWFFNDISGIEPEQNMRYALRAWQLMYPNEKMNIVLRNFVRILQEAKSNYPGIDGQTIIEKEAFPMINHIERVAFSMAVDNYLYQTSHNHFSNENYSYSAKLTIKEEDCNYDKKTWRVYFADVQHKISLEQKSLVLALYKNENQIEGVVFDENHNKLPKNDADFAKLMKTGNLLNFSLGDTVASFKEHAVEKFVNDFADDTYRNFLSWIDKQDNLLNAISDINGGLPTELAATVNFYTNKEWDVAIDEFLAADGTNANIIEKLAEINGKSARFSFSIDKSTAAEKIRLAINKDLKELNKDLTNEKLAERIIVKLELVERLSIPLHFHQVQDRFYLLYKQVKNDIYPRWNVSGKPMIGNERKTIVLINKLAKKFGFSIEKTAI
ncbi:MAG: DUF3536 domain-containing protein [Chitinivibrionia bacterium]|nr:DUF3536 domain-containing protein [Chitinivibrionia bacterium]